MTKNMRHVFCYAVEDASYFGKSYLLID